MQGVLRQYARSHNIHQIENLNWRDLLWNVGTAAPGPEGRP